MSIFLSHPRQDLIDTVQQPQTWIDRSPRKEDNLVLSFEFFPPKTSKMMDLLWHSIQRLGLLAPNFVSVTYGAGGTTHNRTVSTVMRIKRETKLNVAAHLTCIAATCDEIECLAHTYWNAGIRHIVALRGDHPQGCHDELDGSGDAWHRGSSNRYAYAVDLVCGLRRIADFEISVAAYPECHPEAPSLQADIDNLKRKIDAGATRAITQFFFDNRVFMDFYNRTIAARINVPIVAGILPIFNIAKTVVLAEKCGTMIPRRLVDLLQNLDKDPEIQQIIATHFTLYQCLDLYRQGIRHFHFYTLNRSLMTTTICRMLTMHDQLPWLTETQTCR